MPALCGCLRFRYILMERRGKAEFFTIRLVAPSLKSNVKFFFPVNRLALSWTLSRFVFTLRVSEFLQNLRVLSNLRSQNHDYNCWFTLGNKITVLLCFLSHFVPDQLLKADLFPTHTHLPHAYTHTQMYVHTAAQRWLVFRMEVSEYLRVHL